MYPSLLPLIQHLPGNRVKLSSRRLREQVLPDPSAGHYVKVAVGGTLAGHVFACQWNAKQVTTNNKRNFCWITQLVVHRDYRRRGLATGLLQILRSNLDNNMYYGIMSSHPASCMAAAACFGPRINGVSLEFIRDNAEEVIKTSPVPYVRGAKLHGSLFDSDDSTGLVCGVDTGFFVDHAEPLGVLREVQGTRNRLLGELLEGYEYLLVLPG